MCLLTLQLLGQRTNSCHARPPSCCVFVVLPTYPGSLVGDPAACSLPYSRHLRPVVQCTLTDVGDPGGGPSTDVNSVSGGGHGTCCHRAILPPNHFARHHQCEWPPSPPSTPLQSPTWPADTNTVWMADHSPFFYKSLHMGIYSRSDKTQLHVLKSRHALRFSWQPASRFAGQLRRHRAAAIREASPGPLGWQGLQGQADWQTRPLCLPPHDPSAAGVQNPRRWNHRLCLRRTAPRCNTINWSMFYFMSVHIEVILDKPQKHHKWLTLAQVLLSACTEKHGQISELQTLLQTPTFRF